MNAFRIITFALAIVAASAAPAPAHVTVTPKSLAAGTIAELTFRCPNERPAAETTQLTVQMPEAYPLAVVRVRPVPGWHATVTMRTLATPLRGPHGEVTSVVDTITWNGGPIRPGEAQTFTILAGPLPSGVDELPFKAVQTYSDGEVVRWIELRNPGEAEPALPAPVLHVHA